MLKQFYEKVLPSQGVYCVAAISQDGRVSNRFAESLGDLFDLINEFKLRTSNYSIPNHDTNYFWFAVNFLNIIIGYLLVTNCKSIAKFLDKK